ncbi:MAG: CBS domain-containing protein [Planctomycetota bacterium]|jgi:CBS domain-containing protein
MANALQILEQKHADLAWLPPAATVLAAAQLMNERHIGSVLVMEDDRIVGIFTERDVLRRVVAEQRDPATTVLAEVMTSPVAVASPQTTVHELQKVMRDKRIRHVPVVEGERVLGMISINDLNRVQHDVDVETIRYLEQYISVA